MFKPYSADDDAVLALAHRHGLAPASLFNHGDRPENGQHSVLLDGPLGSFAVSTGTDVAPLDASSWAWSSNLPHHVLIRDQEVQVTRWDQPDVVQTLSRRWFDDAPDQFFDRLRQDRIRDGRSMVWHSMDLFRRVRSAVFQAGLPDASSISAYLGILAAACEGYEPAETSQGVDAYVLPDGSASIISQLSRTAIDAMTMEFSRQQMAPGASLKAYPTLALRHASAAIFQEAHHTIREGGVADFFEGMRPARTEKISRGVVHFTPPSLARGLAEQALDRVAGLNERRRIVIADITCGSGAFLIECLRALERRKYPGHIHVYGRDISPPAIDMARFSLSLAASEWPGSARSHIDVCIRDTFNEASDIKADVMVLNPPFLAWTNQSDASREQLRSILGDAFAYRPDISMGFVARALDAMHGDGVLAALVPASTLESAAGAKWRQRLAERYQPSVVARFDNLSIFPEAMVRIGALVLGGLASEPIQVSSGTALEAVGDVLRALRRGDRGDDAAPNHPATWSIRPLTRGLTIAPGQPTPVDAWWKKSGTVPFSQLFDITQGIRTGANKVFALSQRQHAQLPEFERRAFRAAVTSEHITNGAIQSRIFVFYPYHEPFSEISNDAELREVLPSYSALYLWPSRDRLKARKRAGSRWWQLAEARREAALTPPLFITKYFSGPGGVALDPSRSTLVVQGFGWSPREPLLDHVRNPNSDEPSSIAFAYLALFNSAAFFEIVAGQSTITNGGQFDMSHRYTSTLPMIDLNRVGPQRPATLRVLVEAGHAMYRGHEQTSDSTTIDAAVRDLYAASSVEVFLDRTDDISQPGRAPLKSPASEIPEWLQTYLDAERQPVGRKHRVAVLGTIIERAKAGDFAEIDDGLRSINVAVLNDQALITLLRGTFALRPHLPAWTTFRDRVAATFGERGRDVSVMMIGLDS